jgi:hypothetical protein
MSKISAKHINPRPAVPLEPGSCLALTCAHQVDPINVHAYVCPCSRYAYCRTEHDWELCHCGHPRHNHTGALTEDPISTWPLAEHATDSLPDDDTVEQLVSEYAAASAHIGGLRR